MKKDQVEINKSGVKRKHYIGWGVLLIFLAVGALRSFLKEMGGVRNTSFIAGGIFVFILLLFFGIRMIIGRKNGKKEDE